jgi:tyrosinase
VLQDKIQKLAASFPPEKIDKYRDAARSFRIPYWDWSQGDQGGDVPDFFMSDSVLVDTPEETNFEMSNPLHRFDFNPVPQGFEGKVGSAHSDNNPR